MNILRRNIFQITFKNNAKSILERATSYKSAISLESLYPNSTLKLTTPSQPITDPKEKFNGYIPIDQLEITYSRSTGPGGQNVNKVNTKVDLRFHLESAKWIDSEIKSKLLEKLKTKLTKDGYVVFRSDLTRSQQLNLADCLHKLRNCIRDCLVEKPPPSEETQEKIRRRLEREARERLAIKRHRSQLKADRSSPIVD